MRVLLVNTSDRTGGAAVAAHRLMEALNNNGVKAKMLVQKKDGNDITVVGQNKPWLQRWRFLWERWCIFVRLHFSRKNLFSIDIANTGADITQLREFREADVIHLHWINQGFLSLKSIEKILASGKPVVWTMHDLWPATGICHHPGDCRNFETYCHHCHCLSGGGSKNDLSTRIWKQKQHLYHMYSVNFVAVSSWLQKETQQSMLLKERKISVIPNVLSLSHFRLFERNDARSYLGIKHRYVIVFGATRIDYPIKGFGFLIDALHHIIKTQMIAKDDLCLILFGDIKNKELLQQIPIHYIYNGYVDDEDTLSRIYSAANCVVSSSLYETFGQTLIEALACGCLPVTFDNSGQTDIIAHCQNGYLARWKDPVSLAEGIVWANHSDIDRKSLRQKVIKTYSETIVAHQYINLYKSLYTQKNDHF